MADEPALTADTVRCRKCGQVIEGEGFGSPETGWEHPFSCPPIAEDVRPVHNWTWCQKYEPAPCGECSGCLALAEIRARIDGRIADGSMGE